MVETGPFTALWGLILLRIRSELLPGFPGRFELDSPGAISRWAGKRHPDPNMEQIKVLQAAWCLQSFEVQGTLVNTHSHVFTMCSQRLRLGLLHGNNLALFGPFV